MENSKIENSSITASSWLSGTGSEPWNARLNRVYGVGAWCAAENNNQQYLQVGFIRKHIVTQLALQSKTSSASPGLARITKAKISYSLDGKSWSEYEEDGQTKVCTVISIYIIHASIPV